MHTAYFNVIWGVAKQQVIYNLNKSSTPYCVRRPHWVNQTFLIWYQSIYHPLIGFQKNDQSQHNFHVYFTLQWRHNERDGFSNHSIDCSTVCLGAGQRTYQISASLAFERGIRRWPVDSPHKGPVTQKWFRLVTSMIICVAPSDVKDDLIHKSHNAPGPYPITHHFVTEIFFLFQMSLYLPCLPPSTPPIPIPTPTPTPSQSVYHACTQFRKKGVFFNGRREFMKSRKKGIIFQAWVRETCKILHVFISISLFRVWIVKHKCISALTMH